MKATYNPEAKTKWTGSHRKEGKCYLHTYQIVQLDKGNPLFTHAPVVLRIYGTGAQNTACLWVAGKGIHTQGSGKAGGWGYHRPSAAAEQAIRNAGFTLDEPVSGVGEDAIRYAMVAIARALNLENFGLVESHA